MKITVYGGASNRIDEVYVQVGEAFGRELVARGHSLVYGGGAHGCMGAVARGVHSKHGHITAITPLFFRQVDGELFEDCDELIFTDTMRERKYLLEENGDAFVVLPGGAGTFEELFEAFTLKQLGQHDKPIVILNVDGYYDTMQQLLQEAIDKQFIREVNIELFKVVSTIDEALDYIENYQSNPDPINYRGM